MEKLESKIETKEDTEHQIANAGDFDSLYEVLNSAGGLKRGDDKYYSSDKLIESIKGIREYFLNADVEINEESQLIKFVTRTGGLRDKVIELLKKERSL